MPEFACDECGTKLRTPPGSAGRMVRCPKCRATMTAPAEVPDAEYAEPAATPAAVSTSAMPPGASVGVGRRYGFNCQYCSSRLEANSRVAGQEGQCPTCSNTIVIPILDRSGRLIDPMTGKVIKQAPHPVHAYAAAGDRAPLIERGDDGHQYIRCPRCKTSSPIEANNCRNCGMPFTMEGTTLEAVGGGSSGMATASLVLGIVGLPTFCTVIVPLLAVIFGILALRQPDGGGRGMAIAGIICGSIGLLMAVPVLGSF